MTIVRHTVPMVRQGGSPVCWAACAMMLMQYKRNRSLALDELDIGGDPRLSSVPQTTGRVFALLESWGFKTKRSSNVYLPPSRDERAVRLARRQHSRTNPSPTTMNQIPQGVGNAMQQTPLPPFPARPSASETLMAMLQVWGPVILHHNCGAFWYGASFVTPTPTQGYHSVLITGVDTNRNVFFFNNPWGQSDVITSISSIQGSILRWESQLSNAAFTFIQ